MPKQNSHAKVMTHNLGQLRHISRLNNYLAHCSAITITVLSFCILRVLFRSTNEATALPGR